MNFKEAEAKLAEIAGGQYYSLQYEKTTFSDGYAATQCTIYTHEHGHISERTWDRVFQKYKNSINPLVEEVPEDEPMEVPE